jgi:oligopeptide/dipeptide ABC transporter ATP-binding protein
MYMETPALLEIKNLKVRFRSYRGGINAVDGLNLSVHPGEIVGLVGESGCGKSVSAQSILRLLEPSEPVEYEGEIFFENQNLLSLPLSHIRRIRGEKISMIFQDPLSSLNPVYTLGSQIRETLGAHRKFSSREAREKTLELLRKVGIPHPEKRIHAYPHELSGGMRQRGMIAMALACEPRLLLADEPTTALDPTIQAQILELLRTLNRTNNMAVIFISHDLGLVAELCDVVKVMYLGQIVEDAPAPRIFTEPLHPYTQGLIKSLPDLEGDRSAPLYVIPGGVPSPEDAPLSCRFANRCGFAGESCHCAEPPLVRIDGERQVKCWRYGECAHG